MAATQLDAASAALTLVVDVAARLNGDHEIVKQSTDVLECTVRALGANECSLWLATHQGLVCAARAGKTSTPAADLAPHFEAGDVDLDRLCVRRLMIGPRRLGALVLRIENGIPPEAYSALGAVANMLAPVLSWAEQTRILAAEVERRTKQLDAERRFIHQVVDSLPVSLYVIDRQYRIQAWNRKREVGSQGVQREQALGKTIFEILHRAPAEKLRIDFEEVFRTGRIQQFNIETRTPGEARTYRITKIPMQVVDGEPASHVITIGEDVTDMTTSQARFSQSEKLAAMSQLAAGVLHEVSDPLAAIASSARELAFSLATMGGEGQGVPRVARGALAEIDRAVSRCQDVVGGLLDVSRPASTATAPTDVNSLIQRTLGLLAPQVQFKRLSLESVLDPQAPKIVGNAEQLMQVFIALLKNAADAMEGGGSITVRTASGASAQEALIVEVIDEGKGIARADLPHIFEPFYSTKSAGGGAGLGLSICYSIVTGMQGRIEVDSAVGAGSTFRLLLPEGRAA